MKENDIYEKTGSSTDDLIKEDMVNHPNHYISETY